MCKILAEIFPNSCWAMNQCEQIEREKIGKAEQEKSDKNQKLLFSMVKAFYHLGATSQR